MKKIKVYRFNLFYNKYFFNVQKQRMTKSDINLKFANIISLSKLYLNLKKLNCNYIIEYTYIILNSITLTKPV